MSGSGVTQWTVPGPGHEGLGWAVGTWIVVSFQRHSCLRLTTAAWARLQASGAKIESDS
jgi:hypothetical protein